MTTSGSTDWKLTAADIIAAALRKCGAVDPSQTAATIDGTTGLVALNAMIKSWAIDGINIWLVQEAVLHLEYGEDLYAIGGTNGDNFCAASDAVKTTLTANAAASATALTVASNTGVAASDKVGVQLDDGTLHWDVQSGAVSGTTDLTLTTGLASAASSGNYVFAYTTKLTQPTEITEIRLRDEDDYDIPLRMATSIEEYMARIDDKTDLGDATDCCFVPQLTSGLLYVYPTADLVYKRLFMTCRRIIEDFDAVANDADFPAPITEAVIYNLAVRLAPEYGREPSQTVMLLANDGYNIVKRFYGKLGKAQLVPAKRTYRRR
jgi:hypothetical protein